MRLGIVLGSLGIPEAMYYLKSKSLVSNSKGFPWDIYICSVPVPDPFTMREAFSRKSTAASLSGIQARALNMKLKCSLHGKVDECKIQACAFFTVIPPNRQKVKAKSIASFHWQEFYMHNKHIAQ